MKVKCGMLILFVILSVFLTGCEDLSDAINGGSDGGDSGTGGTVQDSSAEDVATDKSALDTSDFSFSGSDDANSVTANFTLPVSGDCGCTISWSSSNTAVVSISGGSATVTRPGDADTAVTLTAIISKNGVSATKTLSVNVKKSLLPPPPSGEGTVCTLHDISLTVSDTVPAGGKHITGMGGNDGSQSAIVIGDYAYVSSYPVLVRIDVSNPASPAAAAKKIKTSSNAELYSQKAIAVDDYLFFANGVGRTSILHLGNPDSPVLLTDINVNAAQMVYTGGLLYVLDTAKTLHIYNISNPWSVSELGSVTTTISSSNFQMVVSGSYVYVAGGWSGSRLSIVDVSVPASPSEVYGGDVGGKLAYTKAAAYSSGRLFMYDVNNRKFFVIDVSDASAPSVAHEIDDSGRALENTFFVLEGSVLWGVNEGDGNIDKIDLSNPLSPSKLLEKQYGPLSPGYSPATAANAAIYGGYLFISCNDGNSSGVDELVIFPKN